MERVTGGDQRRPRRGVRVVVGARAVVEAHATPLEGGDALSALLARAREAGRAEGREEARASVRSEAAGRLCDAVEALAEREQELVGQASRTALELGLVVARELVLREVTCGEHAVEAIVRSALSASGSGRGPCTVHVHPADAAALADVHFRAGTTVEPDPGVRQGDVQVETPMGLMVRELDECLADLSARLREELR